MSLNIKTMALFSKIVQRRHVEERASLLALLLVFTSALKFEKVCLWPPRLFKGNGNANVCCVAGVGKKGIYCGRIQCKSLIWRLDG